MSVIEYKQEERLPSRRVGRVVWLWALLMAGAWAVGMVTNAVNGVVCLEYFAWRLNHGTVGDVVRQGFLEGSATGILLWLMVLPVYCGVTGCRLPVKRLLRAIAWMVVVGLVGHVAGGLIGWSWAGSDPKGFAEAFPVARVVSDVSGCGYVGGAIWGVDMGAVVGYVILIVAVWRAWGRFVREG